MGSLRIHYRYIHTRTNAHIHSFESLQLEVCKVRCSLRVRNGTAGRPVHFILCRFHLPATLNAKTLGSVIEVSDMPRPNRSQIAWERTEEWPVHQRSGSLRVSRKAEGICVSVKLTVSLLFSLLFLWIKQDFSLRLSIQLLQQATSKSQKKKKNTGKGGKK